MNISQSLVAGFALVCGRVSIGAIWMVATTRGLRYKLWWIIGSLFGFVGFAIDMKQPGDLFMQVGVQVPVVSIMWIGHGQHVLLKALFPIVALVAMVKASQVEDS